MAIVMLGLSECTVCRAKLMEGEDIVLFPHFICDDTHPLWRFSDSGMHRACFQDWAHAAEFRSLFNKLWPELSPRRPMRIEPDGTLTNLNRPADDAP